MKKFNSLTKGILFFVFLTSGIQSFLFKNLSIPSLEFNFPSAGWILVVLVFCLQLAFLTGFVFVANKLCSYAIDSLGISWPKWIDSIFAISNFKDFWQTAGFLVLSSGLAFFLTAPFVGWFSFFVGLFFISFAVSVLFGAYLSRPK